MKIKFELFENILFDQDFPIASRGTEKDTEGIAMERLFRGKKPSEISTTMLVRAFRHTDISAIPVFMTDEAFVYYLPVLMQASLDDHKKNVKSEKLGDLTEMLIMNLLKIAEGKEENRLKILSKKYNPAQSREITRFLIVMAYCNCDDAWDTAEEALRKYWIKYF